MQEEWIHKPVVVMAAFHSQQLCYSTVHVNTRHTPRRPAASTLEQPIIPKQRSKVINLFFMNWFGFGNNNGESDSNSEMQPHDTATVLVSSPKERIQGSVSKGMGSNSGSSDVVTIMDSMDQLKRSQRIGKITAALVQELKSITVEGSSENGKVKVTYDGQQNPISTYVDENYYKEKNDVHDFTNALTYAMKDAQVKSIEKMQEKMKNVYSELGFYVQQQ
jgi:nucleoid-associated protein EbfC